MIYRLKLYNWNLSCVVLYAVNFCFLLIERLELMFHLPSSEIFLEIIRAIGYHSPHNCFFVLFLLYFCTLTRSKHQLASHVEVTIHFFGLIKFSEWPFILIFPFLCSLCINLTYIVVIFGLGLQPVKPSHFTFARHFFFLYLIGYVLALLDFDLIQNIICWGKTMD